MYRAANTDEAMLGKWSGFGAEGTKKIFLGRPGGGGRVCWWWAGLFGADS